MTNVPPARVVRAVDRVRHHLRRLHQRAVPPPAAMLEMILGAWVAQGIFRRTRDGRYALNPLGDTLLLVEGVIPDHDREFLGKWTDMAMLIGIAARERTAAEYRKLYQQAGFRLTRVVETASPFSLVEGVAV